MKTSLLFMSTLLLAQLTFAQSYQVELTDFPSDPGKALFWEGDTDAPSLKFLATKNSILGDFKNGRIFLENDYAYSIARKGSKYFLYNGDRETQMVRFSNAYLTIDGIELKRKRNGTGDKITILHPDGSILAVGQIKSKILGKHTLSLDVKEKSPYRKEIMAMLSVDLIETLRHRFDWNPTINYTASRD